MAETPDVSHRLLATRRREHARAEKRLGAVKAQITALDIKLCAAMAEEVCARYAMWDVAEALGLVVGPSTPNDEARDEPRVSPSTLNDE